MTWRWARDHSTSMAWPRTCPVHPRVGPGRMAAQSAGAIGAAMKILQHALGLDQYGHGRAYRNHYCTTEGSQDFEICTAHVTAGRMERYGPSALYGGPKSYAFVVTDAGREYVRQHSPAPSKLTRSQKRYRRYLAADTGETFGEWLGIGRLR